MSDPPLGRGIDVWARGGYITVPPSRHMSGRAYAWAVAPESVPLALAPDWLLQRLLARGTAHPDGTSAEPISDFFWTHLTHGPISKYRDWSATRIADHLFSCKVDYMLVLGLLHVWNKGACSPPLDANALEEIVIRAARANAA